MIALTPALSPRKLLSDLSFSADEAFGWGQSAARNMALTQSCRTAIAMLASAAQLSQGDEVLLSAYNCGTEVDALLAAGLRIRCIECNEQGFLTIDQLEGQIGPRTRAIYVIHLFGWPQQLDEIDRWRKKHGLALLEDCALALFSAYANGVPLGSRGEASVYSFPKSLATPDGGAIAWQTSWPGPGRLAAPPAALAWRQIASKLKQAVSGRTSWLRGISVPASTGRDVGTEEIDDLPADYYFEHWRSHRACAGLTLRLLGHCDPAAVRERRRANYKRLSSLLIDAGMDVVFPTLPDGVCPLGCVVRTGQRQAVLAGLATRGIVVPPWWAGGHRAIKWSEFPIASRLKRTLLPLPVHHHLSVADVEYIADSMIEIFKIASS